MFRKILCYFVIHFLFNQLAFANIEIKARTAILQDYLSGEILYEKEPDRSIYPASMTKIMTSIIAFDLIKSGDLKLDEKFIISEKAWRLSTSGYSSMFVIVGDKVSVEDLLKGIIVASGNDACIAFWGYSWDRRRFAIMMTSKAKEIGMENTNFANSSGINDPDNYSQLNVMIMSNCLIKNHQYFEWFKEKEFTWANRRWPNNTKSKSILYKNMGADGIGADILLKIFLHLLKKRR